MEKIPKKTIINFFEKNVKKVKKVKVIKELKGKSLVEFSLQTGRTHQIRVHCKWIGHSITGDTKYGGDSTLNKDGQLLHAKKLILNHPTTGAEMCFEAEIPENMQKIIDRLNKEE